MAQRYCTNCGAELPEAARFCGGCGRLAHETAAVATSEADVEVPTPPITSPRTPTAPPQRRLRPGAAVAIAVAYLAVLLRAAAEAMTAVTPSDGLATRMGTALGAGIANFTVTLTVVAVALVLAGLYWLAGRSSPDHVSPAAALFNWPVAVPVGLFALGLLSVW